MYSPTTQLFFAHMPYGFLSQTGCGGLSDGSDAKGAAPLPFRLCCITFEPLGLSLAMLCPVGCSRLKEKLWIH